ncbi:MAG: hypothetical protein F6K10_00545 [Moorea sp. SIO2B7]|nr:hypothetical protein [Moorena sp. SIO2B7]
MKCIQCGTDNNYKERQSSRRCKNCGHQFVFEPKEINNHKITDTFFAKVINDISSNKSVFYNLKQFRYYLDKILKFRASKQFLPLPGFILLYLLFSVLFTGFFRGLSSTLFTENSFSIEYLIYIANLIDNIGFIVVLYQLYKFSKANYKYRQIYGIVLQIIGYLTIIVGIIFSVISKIIFIFNLIIGITAIYLGRIIIKNKKPILQTFLVESSKIQPWLESWQAINGRIDSILPSPNQENQSNQINFDISNYSFDKLLICDSEEIAQFLIANNFYFENNCAVLSVTRYPESIFDTVLEMVKQNPELKVYALHHCTPKGIGLVHQLRTSENWFAGSNVTIYDIGLLPRQIYQGQKH